MHLLSPVTPIKEKEKTPSPPLSDNASPGLKRTTGKGSPLRDNKFFSSKEMRKISLINKSE